MVHIVWHIGHIKFINYTIILMLTFFGHKLLPAMEKIKRPF